jgi:hypothetical protein
MANFRPSLSDLRTLDLKPGSPGDDDEYLA